MSGIDTSQNRTGQRGSYFFLSYAHSPPLAGTLQADPDQWVRRFYRDLTDSVRRHAAAPRLIPGFFDQDIPLSANWKASLTSALGAAEVFVPLLSPGYYARSWPGREWASFLERLNRAGVTEPDRRFTPVLWIPLPGDRDLPGLRYAVELGAPDDAYLENGLRTLLRLTPYRMSYRQIVERLASRIVDLAEKRPIPRSTAPDIDEVPSAFPHGADAVVFAITVAAPVLADLPADRDSTGYGKRSVDWRAYPDDQELALVEYAAQVAEQLDFAVVVTGIEQTEDLPGNLPGVILIDPWLTEDERGLQALQAVVDGLPFWVLPLLVLDSVTDAHAVALAGRVRSILGGAAVARTEPARLAVRGVSSLKEFVSLMPILVAEAERQYLRHGPVQRYTARPGSRPRLAGHEWPPSPAQPSEEKDA